MVDISLIAQLVEFLEKRKQKQAIEFLEEILKKGIDPQELIKAMVDYLRQVLILKINPDLETHFTKEESERIKEEARLFKEMDLKDILDLLLQAENKMKYASITQLPLELAIIEYCRTIHS